MIGGNNGNGIGEKSSGAESPKRGESREEEISIISGSSFLDTPESEEQSRQENNAMEIIP